MTREEAVKLYDSKWWEGQSDYDLAKFQLFEDRLCMPFEVFHKAISLALGRDVYTHEFGLNREGLQKELLGELPPPTLEEVIGLIPPEKLMVLTTGSESSDHTLDAAIVR